MKPIVLAILTVFLLASCGDDALIDRFAEVSENGWSYNEVLEFEYEVDDLDHYYQLFANLRIDTDYPVNDFHMQMTTIAPDSSKKVEVISLSLAEKNGKWKGRGLGRVISYQQAVQPLRKFEQKGIYRVSIQQHMREDNIKHVHAAGIRILKSEEIF